MVFADEFGLPSIQTVNFLEEPRLSLMGSPRVFWTGGEFPDRRSIPLNVDIAS